jgi:hypothetical protein
MWHHRQGRWQGNQEVDGFGSGFSGSGLLVAQGAESGKKSVVNSSCVVEKGANDALDSFNTFVGEWRTVGFVVGELGDLAVDDFAVFVQGELALGGHRMVDFDEDIVDVAWHGGWTCAIGVFGVKCHFSVMPVKWVPSSSSETS